MSINLYNRLFYSRVENAFSASGLADFFTKLEAVQYALAKRIIKEFPEKSIKLKELGTGSDPARWKTIQTLAGDTVWEVTLTDFTRKILPPIGSLTISPNFSFYIKKCDLLGSLPKLPLDKRYDVVLATYVFDSVWFAEDVHYEKNNNSWYKAHYKLAVSKNYRRSKVLEKLFADPSLKIKLQLKDFDNIKIAKRLEKVKMENEANTDIIANYYKHKKNISVNYPGGLINKVTQSFNNEIVEDGFFIIGDMAVNNIKGFIPKETKTDIPFYMDDYHTSGKAAKFKIEDYGLAKLMLEKNGFNVILETVEEFIGKSGYEIPIQINDHWIMVVKRRKPI